MEMCHGKTYPNTAMESHNKNVSSSAEKPPVPSAALSHNSAAKIASDKSAGALPSSGVQGKRKRNGGSNGRGSGNNRGRKKRGDMGRGAWRYVTLRPLKVSRLTN